MIEDGETIPAPSTLDDIADDSAMKNAVAILVNVDSEKRVRVNITARESQIDKIDRLAEEAGMTRSANFVQAALSEKAQRNEHLRVHRRTPTQARNEHRGSSRPAGKYEKLEVDRRPDCKKPHRERQPRPRLKTKPGPPSAFV
jgi:hypothetical protein